MGWVTCIPVFVGFGPMKKPLNEPHNLSLPHSLLNSHSLGVCVRHPLKGPSYSFVTKTGKERTALGLKEIQWYAGRIHSIPYDGGQKPGKITEKRKFHETRVGCFACHRESEISHLSWQTEISVGRPLNNSILSIKVAEIFTAFSFQIFLSPFLVRMT